MAATTTTNYSIVIEKDPEGTWSAYVAGLPGVYAVADTAQDAKKGIREALQAHLDKLQKLGRPIAPKAEVFALRYTARKTLKMANLGATLLGARKSMAKARAARMNGRKGGRPAIAR